MLIRKCIMLSICFLIQGCISTQVSEGTLYKYKNKHIREFLSDQVMYNIHNENYNYITRTGGSDTYFLYTPALFVDKQVAAPSVNVENLCAISGGQRRIKKFSSDTFIESGYKVAKAFRDMGLYAHFGAYEAFRDSYQSFEKQKIAYRFQTEKLDEYVNKGYFFDDFSCIVNGKEIWSLSIEPVAVDQDSSGVDQIWMLMTVNS